MFKPTPSKPGLFSVALKRLTALQGSARYAFIPVGLALLFALSFVMTTTPKQAYATPPNTLNFQARLENANGAIVPDGTYNVEFKITNDPSTADGGQGVCSGSCLWREDYLVSGSNGIRVVNGYLSVNLGSVTSFPVGMNWDQSLYLTMDIGGTNSSPFNSRISSSLQFPLYYPTRLPAGYRIDSKSTNVPQQGVVVFNMVGPKGEKLYMSEEARPSSFDLGGFYQKFQGLKESSVSDGAVAVGRVNSGQTEVASRANNKTWILSNTRANIPLDQLTAMMKSLTLSY